MHIAERYAEIKMFENSQMGWSGGMSICPDCGHVETWITHCLYTDGWDGPNYQQWGGPPAWDAAYAKEPKESNINPNKLNPNRLSM